MKRDRQVARRLTFGEVLGICRAKQGLTHEELAELVGWPAWRIRSLETWDQGAVTDTEVLQLAEALDIDPKLLKVAVPR